MKVQTFVPEYVEYIPTHLESGKLYISMKYAIAVHLCACGCNEKVVTPFSPQDWNLQYNGETITLHPSIGNFEFVCRSHYFIINNKVVWCTNEYKRYPKKQNKKRWKRWIDCFRSLF